MLCVECGHIGDSFDKSCEKCGADYPDREKAPPKIESTYFDLEKSCKNIRERNISSGDFRDKLNSMQSKFQTLLKDVENTPIPEEYRQEMQQELNTGIDGIKLYLEALSEMHQYLETRDNIFLDRGLAMAKDANNRLNEALRMNFESYRAIQETAEEFLSTQGLV